MVLAYIGLERQIWDVVRFVHDAKHDLALVPVHCGDLRPEARKLLVRGPSLAAGGH